MSKYLNLLHRKMIFLPQFFRDDHVYDKRQTPDTMSRLNLTISQLAKARTAEMEGLERGSFSPSLFYDVHRKVVLPGFTLGHQIHNLVKLLQFQFQFRSHANHFVNFALFSLSFSFSQFLYYSSCFLPSMLLVATTI